MTEAALVGALQVALQPDYSDEERADALAELWDTDERISVRSFAEAGLLTSDQGVVVRVGETEYQLTIVRSR